MDVAGFTSFLFRSAPAPRVLELVKLGDWPRAGTAENAWTQTHKMETRARRTRTEFSRCFAIIVSRSSIRSASPLREERGDDQTEPAAARAVGRARGPTA